MHWRNCSQKNCKFIVVAAQMSALPLPLYKLYLLKGRLIRTCTITTQLSVFDHMPAYLVHFVTCWPLKCSWSEPCRWWWNLCWFLYSQFGLQHQYVDAVLQLARRALSLHDTLLCSTLLFITKVFMLKLMWARCPAMCVDVYIAVYHATSPGTCWLCRTCFMCRLAALFILAGGHHIAAGLHGNVFVQSWIRRH